MSLPRTVRTPGMAVGPEAPLAVFAGLCIIEDGETTLRHAVELKRQAADLDVTLCFKSSFDKANRTSIDGYRGPGIREGLAILAEVKKATGLPILTDVHETWQVEEAAEVADVLQIPAFLCRQTDILMAAARTGRLVNVKKGQFVSPHDMRHVIGKLEAAGTENIVLTERGVAFGYNTLVNDFRALPLMRSFGYPVVYDATHSVQMPSAADGKSGGDRRMIPFLAKAAAAVGVDGFFFEVHENPDIARSDGPNALPLDQFGPLIARLLAIRDAAEPQPLDND